MLNGLSPILLIAIKKNIALNVSSIPLLNEFTNSIPIIQIPIYLDENLGQGALGIGSGIYVDSETKNIEIRTETDTTIDAKTPNVTQQGLSSTVSLNLLARKDSTMVSLLTALLDLVFTKVTSQEYSITYLNGAMTAFGAMLDSYTVDQDANSDLYRIKVQLSTARSDTKTKAAQTGTSLSVPKQTGQTPTLGQVA